MAKVERIVAGLGGVDNIEELESGVPRLQSLTVAMASVLGGLARFLVLRYWVFNDAPNPHPPDER